MDQYLFIAIDGIIYASWLFIIAVGLTLIYGVMKILNVAHGSLYALGAYAATSLGGYWLAQGYPPIGSYAMLIAAAMLVGLIAGPVIERGLVLVTYAVFLILEDLTKLVWGVDPLSIAQPYSLLGNMEFAGLIYPTYNLAVVLASIVVGGVLALVLNRTRQGKILQAVIHDREMSAAMGINVSRVYLVTFTVGAMLGALGGALTAPTIAVQPGIAADVIVLAFAVVVIGGLGSLGGAALGAVIVGMVRAWAVHKWPEVELFSVYAVMAAVLIMRPKGLFAIPEARKI
jgi:branched-chain amino acid transport system permease protein